MEKNELNSAAKLNEKNELNIGYKLMKKKNELKISASHPTCMLRL